MTLEEARAHIGGGVVYLPTREDGVITSVNDRYVFVKFNALAMHGTACGPGDLQLISDGGGQVVDLLGALADSIDSVRRRRAGAS